MDSRSFRSLKKNKEPKRKGTGTESKKRWSKQSKGKEEVETKEAKGKGEFKQL